MFLLGQTVGKYQILANLGSGGFGTVFLAKDTWIDKKVAIKVPHRQTGTPDDLLQEPRLLAALDHPNIVGILTAERVDGTFFIVMEYVKGESLEAVLDREKSLDVPRAVNYTVQVLKGVEHAHEAQILHRDLRPANVLISESGVCKVADFGTSRLLERSHATTVIGSPPYMAPEQFQGRAVLASDSASFVREEQLRRAGPEARPDTTGDR
jgi:serine/threonine-protein kinase